MAKKPAFLFYSNDFFEGTRTMLPEERACYVDLMVYQHQHDYIPNDIKRVAMYCVGVSEATLEATLEAKFKLCEKGWYNEKLQEVMNDYEDYQKKQSGNGTYGQFIKKLNQDKSIKSPTELKKYIDEVYTKEQLILDLENNNDYKATLEALLKHRLSTRVESESEIENSLTNSSNNTNEPTFQKIEPLTFFDCIEKMKTDQKLKEDLLFIHRIPVSDFKEYLEIFERLNKTQNERERVEYSDKRLHFINWAGKYKTIFEKNRNIQPQQNNKPSNKTIIIPPK